MLFRKLKEINLTPRVLTSLLALPVILALAFAVSAQVVPGSDPNQAPNIEPAPAQEEAAPTIPPAPPGLEGQVTYSPNGEWIPNAEIGLAPAANAAELQALAAAGSQDGVRHVYISAANYNGSQADTACVAGYHMASLWEILDATHIIYDHVAAAKIQADMGEGPVANWWGWARTGGTASVVNTAGQANCNVWASSTAGDYGSIIRLSPAWTPGGPDIMAWDAQTWSCGGIAPVWCVRD